MNERFVPNRLTSKGSPHTLRSGGRFMAEGKGDSAPQQIREVFSVPSSVDSLRKQRIVTPERVNAAKKAWQAQNERESQSGKPLSTDPSTQKIYIAEGVSPSRTPEFARKVWEQVNKGKVLSAEEVRYQEENIALGISPMSGASDETGVGEKIRLGDLITDPHLKPYAAQAEKIIEDIRSGRGDPEEIASLYEKFNKMSIPSDYDKASPEVWVKFGEQKQRIRSAISAALRATMPPSENKNEEIRKLSGELASAVEDENHDMLEDIIKNIDPGDATYAHVIGAVVERSNGEDYMLEDLLEYAVERILSKADVSPKGTFPRFNMYVEMNLDSVTDLARRFDEKKGKSKEDSMFKYLTELREKRYIMHELFRNMKDEEGYKGIVTQHLRKEGFAFVEKRMVGVQQLQQMYEEVLGSDLSLKDGWLTDTDFEKADDEVEKVFRQDANTGDLQKKFKRNNGTEGERPLREWEINRAFHMGRSLNAGTLRRVTYGIMGDIPLGSDDAIKSLEHEFMARLLAPIKTVSSRFFGQGITKLFLERFVDNLKKGKDRKINKYKYGYVAKDEKGEEVEKGFYGKKQESIALLDLGIPDLKSHSWRSRYMFLKQQMFKTEIGIDQDGDRIQMSIGEFVDLQKKTIRDEVRRGIEAKKGKLSDRKWEEIRDSERQPYKEGIKEGIKEEFNNRIREAIGKQRLFLGVLMRLDDLDDHNKQQIWNKAAEFLPSRMAAFMPDEALDIVKSTYGVSKNKDIIRKWKEVRRKIWRIERLRIRDDAEDLEALAKSPTNHVLEMLEKKIKARTMKDYYKKVGLDEKEQSILEKLQQLGKDHAATDKAGNPVILTPGGKAEGGFVKATFPFTAFLDDVPKTDWENLTDEDSDRLLVRDYANYKKGYGIIIGLTANPGAKPQDVVKEMVEGFNEIANPFGTHTAQDRMEPIVDTYLEIAESFGSAKWFGTLKKWFREPRSLAELYGMQSQIAHDEGETAEILTGLAQKNVISDDLTRADKDGKTQYIRMKERNGADWKAIWKMYARLIILLLGPVAGMQFLKMILPGDLAKSLG